MTTVWYANGSAYKIGVLMKRGPAYDPRLVVMVDEVEWGLLNSEQFSIEDDGKLVLALIIKCDDQFCTAFRPEDIESVRIKRRREDIRVVFSEE